MSAQLQLFDGPILKELVELNRARSELEDRIRNLPARSHDRVALEYRNHALTLKCLELENRLQREGNA